MKIVAFAGGVGGAKLAHGLGRVLPSSDLTIVVNTGDDFRHFGLWISPDLDTVCYTLAGRANSSTGWGRDHETWNAARSLEELGAPTWFRLGDTDLATHLERTRRLSNGEPLSEITASFCKAWGVRQRVFPMSDSPIATCLHTDQGDLSFQEYFVHRNCEPRIRGIEFDGAASAAPAPGVVEAISQCDAIVICPSNPWVSIAPILAVRALRESLLTYRVAAVSPIVAGRALKGPAAKMYLEMGIKPSALAVADHYRGLVTHMVIDEEDESLAAAIRQLGFKVLVTRTVMRTTGHRERLARDVLDFLEAGGE